ncbi:hypothetical protein D3C85_841770 [compost metagenome]
MVALLARCGLFVLKRRWVMELAKPLKGKYRTVDLAVGHSSVTRQRKRLDKRVTSRAKVSVCYELVELVFFSAIRRGC